MRINSDDKEDTIKIISYNIHSGKNVFFTPQLYRMIRFLKKEDADIIGIQEINENRRRGHQVTAISQQLNMNYTFGKNVLFSNGYYGIATFTKLPIIQVKHILLPSQREQRGFIDTTVKYRQHLLHIVNTHLGLSKNERREQIKVIEEYLSSLKSPFILLGDFNTTKPFFDFIELTDSAKKMNKEHQPTLMLSKKRIDFIFTDPTLNIINYKLTPVSMSDHYPLTVDVTFNN